MFTTWTFTIWGTNPRPLRFTSSSFGSCFCIHTNGKQPLSPSLIRHRPEVSACPRTSVGSRRCFSAIQASRPIASLCLFIKSFISGLTIQRNCTPRFRAGLLHHVSFSIRYASPCRRWLWWSAVALSIWHLFSFNFFRKSVGSILEWAVELRLFIAPSVGFHTSLELHLCHTVLWAHILYETLPLTAGQQLFAPGVIGLRHWDVLSSPEIVATSEPCNCRVPHRSDLGRYWHYPLCL